MENLFDWCLAAKAAGNNGAKATFVAYTFRWVACAGRLRRVVAGGFSRRASNALKSAWR